MNSVLVEPPVWPRRRWWLLIALIFAGQVGCIFWLSDRTPMLPRPPSLAPRLRLAGNAPAELLTLNDPTLFALPHWEGFSGPAWLKVPLREPPPSDWTEPPRWLSLPFEELGAAFGRFIQTNQPGIAPSLARPEPELTLPEPVPLVLANDRSTWRLEGPLAQRGLLTALELPSWERADILTNSIVQLLVDASGEPISVALLSSCGLSAADDKALALAMAARFEPLFGSGPKLSANPLAQLGWGEMIFEWHTLAPPPGQGNSVK
jgi:hypothetical protein